MISRHWRGIVENDHLEDYIEFLRQETFEKAADIDGFMTGHILTRKVPSGTECLIITEWENMAAVREFAGNNPEIAVTPEYVKDIMVELDDHVTHYAINK